MEKSQKENRLIAFSRKNKKFFSFILHIFTVLGIAFTFLFFLELYLALSPIEERVIINEDLLGGVGEFNFRHHPYLDYVHDYQATENPCGNSSQAPVKIYMYGGSTMFAHSENESIPFYLWEFLCDKGFEVKIENFGQAGYLSSQEVFKLIHQLRTGMNPDIVIFYDGYNDLGVKASGYPHMFLTQQVFEFFAHHETYPFSHTVNYAYSHLANLGIANEKTWEEMKGEVDYIDYFSYDFIHQEHDEIKKHEEAMRLYLENVKIIESLEDTYGFQSFFYWQPDITTKKDHSEKEKEFIEKHSSLINYYKDSEGTVDEFLNRSDKVKDLRRIFDDYSDTIYSDAVHKLPEGNRIVAEKIANNLIEYLQN